MSICPKQPLSGRRQFLPGHRQQIGSYYRSQNVALERTEALPGATCETEAALEPGYPGFDSGSKPSEFLVYVFAAAHVLLLQAALFGKANVLDLSLFGFRQVILGGKTAVQSNLEWITAVDLLLSIEHLLNQLCVSGIALKDHAVQDQI